MRTSAGARSASSITSSAGRRVSRVRAIAASAASGGPRSGRVQHRRALAVRLARDLRRQPGLAHAVGADERDERAGAGGGALPVRAQPCPARRRGRSAAAPPRRRARAGARRRPARRRARGPGAGSRRAGAAAPAPARRRSRRPASGAHAGMPRAPRPGARSGRGRASAGRAAARAADCSASSASISPTISWWRPAARSASIASSAAVRRSSSSRRISARRTARRRRPRAARRGTARAPRAPRSPFSPSRPRAPPRRPAARGGSVHQLAVDPQLIRAPARDDLARRRRRPAACAAARRSSGPSWRRWAAASSPHRPSISRSAVTARLASSPSIARTARCFAPPSASGARRRWPRGVRGRGSACSMPTQSPCAGANQQPRVTRCQAPVYAWSTRAVYERG